MLDNFTILTKGGLVLWSFDYAPVKGSPIDTFIKTILLEERAGSSNSYTIDLYTLRWTFDNDNDIIFLTVYQKIAQISYIDELLLSVKAVFADTTKQKSIRLLPSTFVYFDAKFNYLRDTLEEQAQKAKAGTKMRSFDQTSKGKEVTKNKGQPNKDKNIESTNKEKVVEIIEYECNNNVEQNDTQNTPEDTISNEPTLETSNEISDDTTITTDNEIILDEKEQKMQEARQKLEASRNKKGIKPINKIAKKAVTPKEPVKSTKQPFYIGNKITEVEKAELEKIAALAQKGKGPSIEELRKMHGVGEKFNLEYPEPEISEKSIFTSMFSGLSMNKTLQRSDLEATLAKFREHLVTKKCCC